MKPARDKRQIYQIYKELWDTNEEEKKNPIEKLAKDMNRNSADEIKVTVKHMKKYLPSFNINMS